MDTIRTTYASAVAKLKDKTGGPGFFRELFGSIAITWFLIISVIAALGAFTGAERWAFGTMTARTALIIAGGVFATGVILFAARRMARNAKGGTYDHDTLTVRAVLAMNIFLIVQLMINGRRSIGVAIGLLLIALWSIAVLRDRPRAAGKGLTAARYTALFALIFAAFWIALGFLTKDGALPEAHDRVLFVSIAVAFLLAVLIGTVLFGKTRVFDPRYLAGNITERTRRLWLIVLTIVALAHLGVIGAHMLYRVYAMVTPTYDFGLFAQMFHYLNAHGTLETTLERSRQMSHLHVHFSPIFYVLWPLYKVFPSPYTIQAAQLVIAASAVIPAYLIAKRLDLHGFWRVAVSLMMLIHPALMGSSLYDFHENCFLAPLVLWVLYFMLAEKRAGFYIATILLLMVKEDAVLYVMCIGMYGLTRPRDKRHALAIMVIGAIYFIGVSMYLTKFGTGVMTYRFDNVQGFEELGFFGYVLTLIALPAHVIGQVFTADKIRYLLTMLLPFGLLPILGKRVSRVPLLVPLFVMNLVSNWQYQYDIRFQYHYATLALLAFLTMLALKDMLDTLRSDTDTVAAESSARERVPVTAGKRHAFARSAVTTRRLLTIITLTAFASGVILLTSVMVPKYRSFAYYRSLDEETRKIKAVLDTRIPEDASIRTTAFLTTYLSQRDVIFDIDYEYIKDADTRDTDYIVIDDRRGQVEKNATYIRDAKQQGYVVDHFEKDLVLILKRTDAE